MELCFDVLWVLSSIINDVVVKQCTLFYAASPVCFVHMVVGRVLVKVRFVVADLGGIQCGRRRGPPFRRSALIIAGSMSAAVDETSSETDRLPFALLCTVDSSAGRHSLGLDVTSCACAEEWRPALMLELTTINPGARIRTWIGLQGCKCAVDLARIHC